MSVNQSKVINATSPYYLHSSDNPDLIFMTHLISESGDNCFTWRRSFINEIYYKNKASFVDGTIQKPDVDSLDLQSWIQCNAVVLSWLTNALAKELQGSAAHVKLHEKYGYIWKKDFTQGIVSRVYKLKLTIALLQQEKSSISCYCGKLKTIWGELQGFNLVPSCKCGCTYGATKRMQFMREGEKVFDFLMGLDEVYSTVRSQILSVDLLPNLGRAYAIAAQEEKQRLVVDLSSRKLIGVGREWNGLYYLETMRGERALIASDSVNASLWH
ncbi:PREDICTED: uncharacterized protein LOC108660708 [Theobroma cacao]|uniref:Uncharacterized protein LOC108660708 n=1 Tax=Theobroma cacao TaxID=3641 RepID=A0AB32VUP8_THECC|nr:PREDICTED: uncharacterized protein LOC108660708 [Theobroma cacao]